MFTVFCETLTALLELNKENISLTAMILRILIVYGFGIIVLNVINKRFLGEKTPLDIILRFVIGSCLANAIVGSSPYFETLGMVFVIVIVHWLLSLACFYNRTIDRLLKGKTEILYAQGVLNWRVMKRYHLTEEDIMSEIRKTAGLVHLKDVHKIFIEDSGEVSVIPKNHNHTSINAHLNDDIDD